MRSTAALCAIGLLALAAGCGGSSVSVVSAGGATLSNQVLASISVSPTGATVPVGLTTQFTATGLYSEGAKQDITSSVAWTSSNPAVATISSAGTPGFAKTVAIGTTTITATSGGFSASATLNVTAATLQSISVTPAAPSIGKGTSQQFVATGIYSDNTTQNLTAAVTWASTAPAIAAVSNTAPTQGLASALVVGAASITATLNGISGSAPLTVTGATLVSIAVTPTTPSVTKGGTQQFTATGIFSDQTNQNLTTAVTWTTGTAAVASIGTATGLASALSAGTTTITAAVGAITGSTTLTVTNPALVSITVTPAAPSIPKGETETFTAMGTYSDGSMQLLATAGWTSSNAAIAPIGNAGASDGVATGLAVGTATITATLGAISGTATLTVTPAQLASIAITPAAPSIGIGAVLPFTATGTNTDGTTEVLTLVATWNSTVPATAVISNAGGVANGTATALAIGTTAVTAVYNGITSPPVTLTVTAATVTSISVLPANRTVGVGYTQPYVAVASYTDGSTQNVTSAVTWTSGTPAVATVSTAPTASPGLAKGLVAGTTVITAAVPAAGDQTAVSGTATLTVKAAVEYAYSANYHGPNVSQFSVGPGGLLTPLVPATVPAGVGSFSITADPSGQHVYVADYGSGFGTPAFVSQYSIGATGLLTPMTPRDITAGVGAQSIVIDPAGLYAYTANYWDGSVSQYTVGATGALAAMAPAAIAAGAGAASVVVDPTDRYVYVANFGVASGAANGTTVSQFSIGPGGVLTPLTPATAPAGTNPVSLVADPTGRFLYVANYGTGNVSQFSIGAGGALTPLATPAVPAGAQPFSIAVDATGKYAYVANSGGNSVSQYTIGIDGTLTAMIPATAPTAPGATGPAGVSVDPTNTYVYVANRTSNSVSQYLIGPTGALTLLTPPTAITDIQPTSVVAAF